MNLYRKIIKKLFYKAFPEMRAQEYTRIMSVTVEPETIKACAVEKKEIVKANLDEIVDYKLVPEIATQLRLRGLVHVEIKTDHLLDDMCDVFATVCAIYPDDLKAVKK